MVGRHHEQRRFEEAALVQQPQQPSDAQVCLVQRVAQRFAVRPVIVPHAVCERQLAEGEHRRRVAVVGEEHQHLSDPARIDDGDVLELLLAVRLPARIDVRLALLGDRAQPVPVADDPPFQHGVVRAARAGLVDRRREGAFLAAPRSVDAVERLVERLDLVAQELRGVKLLALRRNRFATLAQVVGGVDDVMVAAPAACADGVVAGPGDAGEVHDAAVAEHVPAFDDAAQVRDGVAVLQTKTQLRVAQPVQVEEKRSLRRRAFGRIDDLIERPAVLALEVDLG